jgi:hypothetical protein
VIAGLTGHQKLGDQQTVQWVEEQLSALLVAQEVTGGWMCLAVGADQMYATLLLRRGLPYRVVLPCERYEKTFTENERETYSYLLSKADSVVALNFVDPTERAFYEAGKEVVNRSEILIAVWDGKAAKGLGGTADIVHFAQSRSKRVLHIDTVARVVRVI